jgi:hypothetical protein
VEKIERGHYKLTEKGYAKILQTVNVEEIEEIEENPTPEGGWTVIRILSLLKKRNPTKRAKIGKRNDTDPGYLRNSLTPPLSDEGKQLSFLTPVNFFS